MKCAAKELRRRRPAARATPGTIGGDVHKKNYIAYLADRYNEYREIGIRSYGDTRPFHYSVINQNIGKDFGAYRNNLPVEVFASLASYLQAKIDGTVHGQNNGRKGSPNYDSFDGYVSGVLAKIDAKPRRRRIVESFDVFNVPADIQAEIREALDSDLWDRFRDCDGCTGVSEVFWPTIYFPPCLRHDFDCHTGHNGLQASRRFYRIQRAYGVGRLQAGVRFAGVTVAWYAWMKWRQTIPLRCGCGEGAHPRDQADG